MNPWLTFVFSGLDEVEEVLCQRCRALIKRPELLLPEAIALAVPIPSNDNFKV
jgi:hypothetical protein